MKNERILKFKHGPGQYVYTSFPIKKDNVDLLVRACVSFVYVNEENGTAVEWETEHGPIQIFFKAEEGPEAIEHYTFPFIKKPNMEWSQMAVYTEGLPRAAHLGQWDYIFHVLEKWSIR